MGYWGEGVEREGGAVQWWGGGEGGNLADCVGGGCRAHLRVKVGKKKCLK